MVRPINQIAEWEADAVFNLGPVPVPDLTGKTILVTGAGKGIGAALVRVLADHGARVFAGCHDGADIAPAQGIEAFALDVTDQEAVRAAVTRVEDRDGKLDVLVNNAGIITPIGKFETLASESLGAAFDVNVISLHRMTLACLPLLTASRGTVVNAGTGAATTAMEGWTAYCTSKAAARMMTMMMDEELSAYGINSFFIGIPPTDTAMQGEIRKAGLNPISKIAQSDLVSPEVPARVMAWLCSDAAKTLETCCLDVRDPFFTEMMDLSPALSAR